MPERSPAATTTAPLDRFIPRPDVRERFETTIRAPAEQVLQVAADFDMQSLRPVRAIFRLRESLLGSRPTAAREPMGILEETRRLGWGLLEAAPGRFVVCGARCQPWRADVAFTAIDPEGFAAYSEPEQVKIAWTLEAEPIAPGLTRFAQETRVVATDEAAREKFRRYWRWARFGIIAIRLLLLPAVRRAAERQHAAAARSG
jgi:hypothetical protein